MYSKLITSIIGICAFFGMLIFAGTALKDKDIGIAKPSNAKPEADTQVQTEASADMALADSSQQTEQNMTTETGAQNSSEITNGTTLAGMENGEVVFYDVGADGTPQAGNLEVDTQLGNSPESELPQSSETVTLEPVHNAPVQKAQVMPHTQPNTQPHTQPNSVAETTTTTSAQANSPQNSHGSAQIDPAYINVLLQAETNATSEGAKRVLQTARKMALTDKAIISGGCWDYINAVYDDAGVPQVKRRQLFNGEYKTGPYADQNLFQPADWLYFVNLGYNDVEHSSLFIGWTDRANNKALMLTYGGENRAEPARYRVYDLSHVYGIVRPSSQVVTALQRPATF